MPVNRIIATEEILWPNFSKSDHQEPVDQKVDNAIHWITLHSVVNAIVSLILLRWIVIYEVPVVSTLDSSIQETASNLSFSSDLVRGVHTRARKRAARLAPSVTRVVICVSRAFCSTDEEKRETARSLSIHRWINHYSAEKY